MFLNKFLGKSYIFIKTISAMKNQYMYLLCFLWLKYLSILLAESLHPSTTYFAQYSAGKIYQGLVASDHNTTSQSGKLLYPFDYW